MSDTVISIEGLSKRYLLGHRSGQRENYTVLRDVLTRSTRNLVRKAADFARCRQIIQGDEIEEFWALKDVSFDVKRGEVIGIVGRNGAGKSTLLKILSRITEPTTGRVRLGGRVASLLEVGTGFHPELTGRENIYLNGAILGMTRREIRRKFDEIVAFAEVDKFLDTPVKHYSSGMYVRLAFAVAAHLEPEILIVDEVLAVGDAEFQKRCLGKMEDVSRREGRTILFVSHNMGALASLCTSCLWMDRGSIRSRGQARSIVGEYLGQGAAAGLDRTVDLKCVPRLSPSDRLSLESLEWLCDLPLRHGEPVRARITFCARTRLENVSVGLGFSDGTERRLLTYDTDLQQQFRPELLEPGVYACEVEIDRLPLGPDVYYMDVGCRSGDTHSLDYVQACSRVEVVPGSKTPTYIMRKGAGVRLASNWTWEHQT
jgi:lipopolysaccharide transport system ATP-binding protein